MRIVRWTEYTITPSRSRMSVIMTISASGAGRISGWIEGDWKRLAQIDAFVATLAPYQWERGNKHRFTYSFGPGALSHRVALDLDAVLSADVRPKRSTRGTRAALASARRSTTTAARRT